MIRIPIISCLLLVTIAACNSRGPVDAQAKATTGLPDVSLPAPTAIGEPHGPTVPAKAEPPPAASIPAALQVRWALAPGDCAASTDGAKSLLVVTPHEIHFFESHAVPAAGIESDANSICGTFAFTGEGRSWTKYEALKLTQQRLTRTEINPSASFSYARCS